MYSNPLLHYHKTYCSKQLQLLYNSICWKNVYDHNQLNDLHFLCSLEGVHLSILTNHDSELVEQMLVYNGQVDISMMN